MLVPLLLALILLATIQHIKQNPLNSLDDAIACPDDNPLCAVLEDLARDASNVKYDLHRQYFDKETLPVMQIYLTNGSLKKLYRKRSETLKKPGQILTKSSNDWVKASIMLNDGNGTSKLKARLRLKGDWSDHYEHPTKLSFRIKIVGEGYAFGMKRFSIQHPNTRNFQAEVMMLNEMRRWGILAPRYQFIDVRINDYPIGIMALEEHVAKEMLESQRRREGPVVVVDEDPVWRQKDLNAQTAAATGSNAPPMNASNLKIRDLPVKQFNAPTFLPGSTGTTNAIRATSLYRDFLDHSLPANHVFDLEQMARWWVLVNTWYSCHGVAYHNRRFYFNPTTNLLEPIAFDNAPHPSARTDSEKNCDSFIASKLLGNQDFQRHVLDFSQTLLTTYRSPEWQAHFREEQAAQQDLLLLEGFDTVPLLAKDIVQNLSYFLKALTFDSTTSLASDATNNSLAAYPDAPLYSHLRAFVLPGESRMSLELKNMGYDPIKNVHITITDTKVDNLIVEGPKELPAYAKNRNNPASQHIATVDIDRPFEATTDVSITYTYRDKAHTISAVPQYRNHNTGFQADSLSILAEKPGVRLDFDKKRIEFNSSHEFSESLALDKGWAVTLSEGSNLKFIKGATLKIRGPLYIRGTEAAPVRIEVEPAADFQGVGAWGGIIVSQSERKSHIEHAIFKGSGEKNLPNRMDYYGITGCLTFYESNVKISRSTFSDMHCEDALNIVRSEFTISNTTVQRARADGFDSDFSTGEVRNSAFRSTGNDAVDVSGTQLSLRDIQFHSIGDKAISVGEESSLDAQQLDIQYAATGVASKDKSKATVRDSLFANISGSGLITYIKKNEYGGASIDCNNCSFTNTRYIATNQTGSEIRIDGVPQNVTNFQESHLLEAGFVTQ